MAKLGRISPGDWSKVARAVRRDAIKKRTHIVVRFRRLRIRSKQKTVDRSVLEASADEKREWETRRRGEEDRERAEQAWMALNDCRLHEQFFSSESSHQ